MTESTNSLAVEPAGRGLLRRLFYVIVAVIVVCGGLPFLALVLLDHFAANKVMALWTPTDRKNFELLHRRAVWLPSRDAIAPSRLDSEWRYRHSVLNFGSIGNLMILQSTHVLHPHPIVSANSLQRRPRSLRWVADHMVGVQVDPSYGSRVDEIGEPIVESMYINGVEMGQGASLIVELAEGNFDSVFDRLNQNLEVLRHPFEGSIPQQQTWYLGVASQCSWWGELLPFANNVTQLDPALETIELRLTELRAVRDADSYLLALDAIDLSTVGLPRDEKRVQLDFNDVASFNSALDWRCSPQHLSTQALGVIGLTGYAAEWIPYSFPRQRRVYRFDRLRACYVSSALPFPAELTIRYEEAMLKLLRLAILQRAHELEESRPDVRRDSFNGRGDWIEDPVDYQARRQFVWSERDEYWYSSGADAASQLFSHATAISDDAHILRQPFDPTPERVAAATAWRDFVVKMGLYELPPAWNDQP